MKLRAAILCLLFFCAVALHAQMPPAEKTDPAKKAAIRKLMALTGESMKFGDTMRQMLPQMRKYMDQFGKDIPPEDRERMNRAMDRVMAKVIDQMEGEMHEMFADMVPIYAKHFTHDEIKAILAFYESPAGKKLLGKGPEMAQELMVIFMPRMQKMQKSIIDHVSEELRKEFPDMPLPGEPGVAAQEASAVGSLRTLNTAIYTYSSTYGTFPKALANLGPGNPASEKTADLVDSVLASGTKNGYTFIYTPGEKDANITKYTIAADPIENKGGRRFFFTDNYGVIRFSKTGRANVSSPPIS